MIDEAITTLIREATELAVGRVQNSASAVDLTKGLPKILYTRIHTHRSYTDDGETGLRKAHYQLDLFADEMETARDLATTLANPVGEGGLDGFSGVKEHTRIERIYFDDESFQRSEAVEGKDKGIARYVLEMFVDHRRRPVA